MTKPQPRTQICTKHMYDIDSLSLVRNVLPRIILFNPGIVSEFLFEMVWADFSPNYLLSSDSSVYFNKLHSNTSSGSAHSKSKSQTKNIRTTWNSIDPNGYSMGSKSNMNPNLMKFITQHSSVHVMRKEKARRKSEAACWNYQNLIPHTVPTPHYSSQLIVTKMCYAIPEE